MCFVDATFLIGETFDEDPMHIWAAQLLESEEHPPATKASRLLDESIRRYNLELEGETQR